MSADSEVLYSPQPIIAHPAVTFPLLLSAFLGTLFPGCRQEPGAKNGPTPQTRQEPTAEWIRRHNQGVGLMGQFAYDEAVKRLESLAKETPHDTSLQVDLAIALLNRQAPDDLQRSAEILQAVMDADPGDLRAPYCRALLRFHEGETAAARQLFQQVSDADPHDGYAVYFIGQCDLIERNFASAMENFERVQQIDPHLRSAYYGAFQAAQRLNRPDAARTYLAEFEKLSTNPQARLAELKYSRMGPKAEVQPRSSAAAAQPSAPPPGAIFAEPVPLLPHNPASIQWPTGATDHPLPYVGVADVNGDGCSDLLVANITRLPQMQPGSRYFTSGTGHMYNCTNEHILSDLTQVSALLWGDYDSDGLLDVYACRQSSNQLWRQTEVGQWSDVTESTQTAGNGSPTVDGACYDLDHDGDLDYLLVHGDGPIELLSNNRDGTFRTIAAEMGLVSSNNSGGRRAIVADLDTDDDADVMILHRQPPHDVFINDRLWRYRSEGESFANLQRRDFTAAIAVDSDVDGQLEFVTLSPAGIEHWQMDASDGWQSAQIAAIRSSRLMSDYHTIGAYDANGDTRLELLAFAGDGWTRMEFNGSRSATYTAPNLNGVFAVAVDMAGPAVVGCCTDQPPWIWRAGPGRYPFSLLQFSGRTDRGLEMRTNASGIGVTGGARLGSRWFPLAASRSDSGPGQHWQPTAIGMGGSERIDFLRLLWPDGVSQTELQLEAGKFHLIAETQRQAGSCPLVFVWDGKQYQFIADILGAGGIGFNVGKGEYYPPRPHESLLLPAEVVRPLGNHICIKLGEPMEELCYFDGARLVVYDLPPPWQMTLDERFAGSEPLPTGKPRFFQHELLPTQAINDRLEDILPAIYERDDRAAPLRHHDCRFTGFTDAHSVTLTFDTPVDSLSDPLLVFDGWVEYAYSQTAFAAWQAGQSFQEPSLEARGADGTWQLVGERFGYPAGTARQGSVPLRNLPTGTRQLRITSNMHIYWDRLAVVDAGDHAPIVRDCPLRIARVADVGFARQAKQDQRRQSYDYTQRNPLGDTRHPTGYYTEYGDCFELVSQTDDAVAIIGPGEELHVEFDQPDVPLPEGWRRYFVLEIDGWCKDADLFTKDSQTVAPLPTRGALENPDQAARREALHLKYNTRFRAD